MKTVMPEITTLATRHLVLYCKFCQSSFPSPRKNFFVRQTKNTERREQKERFRKAKKVGSDAKDASASVNADSQPMAVDIAASPGIKVGGARHGRYSSSISIA
jgi:hypothetical protein